MTEIEVFPDPAVLAGHAASRIVRSCELAIEERGCAAVALSGGTTPRATYGLLANGLPRPLAWDRIQLFFGDERLVPPDHEASNYRMVEEVLLRPAGIPPARCHRVATELPSPAEVASDYEETIRRALEALPDAVPVFDLVILGLGVEGHTASLFPGSRALQEKERLVLAVEAEAEPRRRATLTPPIIRAAREVLVLVSGDSKADALAAFAKGKETDLPLSVVRPEAGILLVFADDAAARLTPVS